MDRFSFATLITMGAGGMAASHVPLLWQEGGGPHGTLIGHLARPNPQWEDFAAGAESLAIFHGPHAYISPSWYTVAPSVPTWNYAVVHAYGTPQVLDDPRRVRSLLEATIHRYESNRSTPWDAVLPDDYWDKMMRGIVAFAMPITRIEGKTKLGQNRTEKDRQQMLAALRESGDSGDAELANFMLAEQIVPDVP